MSLETFTFIINRSLHEPYAGLLSGMVFGTRATLDPSLHDALIQTGTLHLIALSGMNIAILTGFVSALLLLFFSRRISALLSVLIIIGYILLVGPSPTIVRAGIMGSLTLLALVFGRQSWALWALGLAVIIMLVLNPLWLWDISFQLSSMATLGLILFGPSHGTTKEPSHLKDKFIDFVKAEFHLTLAAQVFTVPIILYYFHRVSLISPVANVLISWTVAPITILGLLAAFGGSIWFPLGQLAAWVAWPLLFSLISIVYTMAKVPFASVGW